MTLFYMCVPDLLEGTILLTSHSFPIHFCLQMDNELCFKVSVSFYPEQTFDKKQFNALNMRKKICESDRTSIQLFFLKETVQQPGLSLL